MFKAVITFGSGETYEVDELFETREEAQEAGLYALGCGVEGAEILNMSNPGDNPMLDESYFDDAEIDVFEV